MACDIRIASENAFFRAAGINNGLSAAELGLSFILPRVVGTARAFDIMLSGRDVDAAEAERIGMVSRVVSQEGLLGTCYQLAEQIVSFSRLGVEFTKQMLWDSLDAGSFLSHINHEAHAQLFMRQNTRNFEEAIKARKQKRKPAYQD
jgi:enoyl-CoA hydratase